MPSPYIHTKCLGNILRVDVRPHPGQHLEVSVVVSNSAVKLTQSLAKRCGFSMTHKQGTIMIYVSLHNCFAQNLGDGFTTVLNLRFYSKSMVQDEVYQVAETCHYRAQASREIVCDRNYMEVSVKRALPDDYALPLHAVPKEKKLIDSGFKISSLVFFTPEEKKMTLQEAHKAGYGVANTASRFILRSCKSAPETYIQHVGGVPMSVLQASAILEKKWFKRQIDTAAACPVLEGSVYFTANVISWFLPTRIDPLISSKVRLLEVHVGLDGRRLDPAEMSARRYNLTVDNKYILVQIPIGAPGGFFMSLVRNNQYLVCYVIEPMLELLWIEEATNEDTRYKVLLPIMTPPEPQPLKLQDDTVPEENVFKVTIGPLASDVVLLNVTFDNELLSVHDCNERGFNVQERRSQSSGLKFISLQVPFADRLVQQTKEARFTVYSLHLTFGLVVLPKMMPFCHTAHLQARLADETLQSPTVSGGLPLASGGCDAENFYILVQYGTQGHNFQTNLGKVILTRSLAQEYGFTSNGTHFSIVVPFSSPVVVYEAIEGSSIRSTLDVTLINPENNHDLNAFTLTCLFHSTLTECLPNGTMTALAVKLASVPGLNPSQLTLLDPTCGPVYSNDRYAYFVFTGNTCGTTRKFLSNVMLYENEISLPDHLVWPKRNVSNDEPQYILSISCYYEVNASHSMAFHTRPRRNVPYAENRRGELQVVLRLAVDDSYSVFYSTADYPISKYLQQPLYFEVALRSTNPKVSLELETCWATVDQDRRSKPTWNLIINGCANSVEPYQVIFHPVWEDNRVEYPSHVKRFAVHILAFAQDQDNLNKQLYVHCDVKICDSRNHLSEACKKSWCYGQDNRIKGGKLFV
ncbi:uncharacterized protein LOC133417379 [Phycodurus eques]|uniref:uncharacterized protein LOC133417379 n=1 Tax=Phycodurus eques TaxID=693459 RepID=UPI002ACD3E35|nr:uncharacterized protein LOC133417379 [Phycodurus eques]